MSKAGTKRTRRERPARGRGSPPPDAAAGGRKGERSAGAGPAGRFASSLARRRDVLGAAALVLLVAAAYVPALSAGFVWDDRVFTEEEVIRDPSGLRSIWFAPRQIENEGHYWPVVYTSFWLEYRLWGLDPAGYHAVNVLLHAVNVLLLWRLLLCLALPGAWAAAAVFAVHPLHVESVAWVIERKDLLSALFYLAAALVWMRFARTPGWGSYLLALGLFAAGLLSKSIVVTLPAALLILHWWKRGRVTPADLLRLAPFFLVAAGVTAADLAYYAAREPLALGYSLVERTLIAARALWFYAGKLLWPADLAVIYPLWDVRAADPLAWAYVAGAAGLAAALWRGRTLWGRGPLAGAAFFAVTLSPVLGFVDYGYMQFSFVAERFQYLAGIGVLAVITGAVAHHAGRLTDAPRIGAAGLLVVVLGLLATLTWRHAGIYRDEVTFFSHIVSFNPEARGAQHNLGNALLDAGRSEEAVAALRMAVRQYPDDAGRRSDLGRALLRTERIDEAAEHLLRAVELDPGHRNALQNTAEVLRRQERFEEAVAYYRRALDVDPGFALGHVGLGDVLVHLQRHEEALESLARGAAIEPTAPVAASRLRLMGMALHELGRLDEAAEQYERALRVAPDDTDALERFAMLRFAQARYEEALGLLRTMVRMQPANANVHANVGVTLYYLERYEEAAASTERALEIDPDHEAARDLAQVLRDMPRSDDDAGGERR